MKPVRSILDSKFKYTNAASTDIRKTFERAREEMRSDAERRKQSEKDHKLISMRKR